MPVVLWYYQGICLVSFSPLGVYELELFTGRALLPLSLCLPFISVDLGVCPLDFAQYLLRVLLALMLLLSVSC